MYICICFKHMYRYNIMRKCWNFMPEDRPYFTELVQDVSQQLQQPKCQKPPPLKTNPSAAYLKVL